MRLGAPGRDSFFVEGASLECGEIHWDCKVSQGSPFGNTPLKNHYGIAREICLWGLPWAATNQAILEPRAGGAVCSLETYTLRNLHLVKEPV